MTKPNIPQSRLIEIMSTYGDDSPKAIDDMMLFITEVAVNYKYGLQLSPHQRATQLFVKGYPLLALTNTMMDEYRYLSDKELEVIIEEARIKTQQS